MSCDLVIQSIVFPAPFPAPIDAPCPTQVTVVVQNIGTIQPTTAFGTFVVCLDILDAIEGRPLRHFELSHDPGEGGVLTGQLVKVTFNLSFPCAPSVVVRATADCNKSVLGNLRSNPESTVIVPLVARPSLVTRLVRLGLRDSGGIVTFEPSSFCPGGILVVEGEVQNRGCAPAPASVAVVNIAAAGQPPVVDKQIVPSLAAGATHFLLFVTQVPTAAPTVTVEICADALGAVTGQCNAATLCDARTIKVSGSASSASLAVKQDIVPGERPIVTWEVQNGCVDLGLVTARISFAGTELYKSAGVAIGLQSAGGEVDRIVPGTPAVPPTAVAAGLWTVGTKLLDLVADGSGAVAASLSASAILTIVREPVGTTWWMWTGPPAGSGFPWKTPYGVSGRFTNLGQSRLTPNAVTLREHDTAMTVPPPSDVLTSAVQSLGPLVPGATLPVAWPLFTQTWRWFDIVSMLPTGPQSKTFDYTAEIVLQDDFGNAYPVVSSAALQVVVTVSGAKFYFAFTSYMGQLTAAVLLIMAGAAAAGIITIIGAGALAGAAGTAFTIALGFRGLADDPPIADFDYDDSARKPEPSAALARLGEELAGLRAVLELASRVATYSDALARIEGKLIGARVDGRDEAARQRREDYAAVVTLLERTEAALPAAAAQATEELSRLVAPVLEHLQASLEELRRGEISDALREVWALTGLPLTDIEKLPGTVAADQLPALPEIPQRFAEAAASAARETLQDAAETLSRLPA